MADLLSFDQRDGIVWFNGEMIQLRDSKVHLLSHALHYGSAIFEGERVYDGEIFKLREHTERLFEGAGILDFEIPYTV
ncbi:MAG: branched-chain amino acid aminotransferase, partial [Pseudomonadota bacterium]